VRTGRRLAQAQRMLLAAYPAVPSSSRQPGIASKYCQCELIPVENPGRAGWWRARGLRVRFGRDVGTEQWHGLWHGIYSGEFQTEHGRCSGADTDRSPVSHRPGKGGQARSTGHANGKHSATGPALGPQRRLRCGRLSVRSESLLGVLHLHTRTQAPSALLDGDLVHFLGRPRCQNTTQNQFWPLPTFRLATARSIQIARDSICDPNSGLTRRCASLAIVLIVMYVPC
jgi:hypothetical protein